MSLKYEYTRSHTICNREETMWRNQRKVSKNTRKSHNPHHRTSVSKICSGCLFDKCKERCRTRRYSMIWPYCIMVLTDHSLVLAIGFLQAKLADGEITQLYCFCELYLYITMSCTTFWRPILKAFDTASLLEVSYLERINNDFSMTKPSSYLYVIVLHILPLNNKMLLTLVYTVWKMQPRSQGFCISVGKKPWERDCERWNGVEWVFAWMM